MTNLLALCKPANAPSFVKRVKITQPVQEIIGGLFQQQALDFLEGVEDEVPFGNDWKPDDDEILTLSIPHEISVMRTALEKPLSLETIDASRFSSENIKGLFIFDAGKQRILIQSFAAQQILSRARLALIFDGDTFRQVTEPSFTLDSKLVAIAEGDFLKFKSFNLIKRLFDLTDIYKIATDRQLEEFCAHEKVHANAAAFKAAADQIIRKLAYAVSASGVLDNCSVSDIQSKAQNYGIPIKIVDGKIEFPTERREIKHLLRFLDDSIYEGPLSARIWMTNSKQALAR